MLNQKTTTTKKAQYVNVWELPTIEEELALCEAVRHIDLNAMLRSTGHSDALADIIKGCYLDTLIEGEARTARQERADELRTISKKERAKANTARQLLKRVRISEADRAEAEENLNYYTILADNDLAEAQEAEAKNNELLTSLATDMRDEIWIELQAIKENQDRQTAKAFGELCKAGREYIQNMTAVTTVDGMHCIYKPLSTAEAHYYMTRYNVDPGARPRQKWLQTAKGCTGFYTLEAHERKRDTDPAKVDSAIIANYARYNDSCVWYYENITLPTTHSGYRTAYPALSAKAHAIRFWNEQTPAQKATALGLDPAENPILYLVLHVPTIRTHYSVDEMGERDPRTAEAVTESTLNKVDVIALAERANLGEQARKAISALFHSEAVQTARTARNEALTKGKEALAKLQADRAKAKKKPYNPGKVRQMKEQYEQTAERAYDTALWKYALTYAGYKDTAQAEAKKKIIKRMTKAYFEAPDSLTPGKVDFAKLMKQTHRGHAQHTGKAVDMVAVWQTFAQQTTNHKPVIKWNDGEAPEALTPAEVEAIETEKKRKQTEHLNRYGANIAYLEYRRELRAEKPRTAWNALNATRSALVFMDRLTAEEQAEIMRAKEAEQKSRRDKLQTIAEEAKTASQTHREQWASREAVTIPAKVWNAWTPAQRLTHIRNTAEAGKRTVFA